ncbi:hypothetical protein ACS0TY_026106 [Phlomoides rotata]
MISYSTDEIDQKTKALRASDNFTIGDDASSSNSFSLEKMIGERGAKNALSFE